MLDSNNRNLESFSIHCDGHDNPLIELGEMQYYAKIEGTDRFTNHDSNLNRIHPWVNSILDANNIPSLKSIFYATCQKPINVPQCSCSPLTRLMCLRVVIVFDYIEYLLIIGTSCSSNCDPQNGYLGGLEPIKWGNSSQTSIQTGGVMSMRQKTLPIFPPLTETSFCGHTAHLSLGLDTNFVPHLSVINISKIFDWNMLGMKPFHWFLMLWLITS